MSQYLARELTRAGGAAVGAAAEADAVEAAGAVSGAVLAVAARLALLTAVLGGRLAEAGDVDEAGLARCSALTCTCIAISSGFLVPGDTQSGFNICVPSSTGVW